MTWTRLLSLLLVVAAFAVLAADASAYYNSSLGRFIQRDPIVYRAGDANVYRYVGNRPTIATDPYGTVAAVPNAETVPLVGKGKYADCTGKWKTLFVKLKSVTETPISAATMRAHVGEINKILGQCCIHVNIGWRRTGEGASIASDLSSYGPAGVRNKLGTNGEFNPLVRQDDKLVLSQEALNLVTGQPDDAVNIYYFPSIEYGRSVLGATFPETTFGSGVGDFIGINWGKHASYEAYGLASVAGVGRTMAHELVHVLMGNGKHSRDRTHLMGKNWWNVDPPRLRQAGRLCPENQCDLMRRSTSLADGKLEGKRIL